MGRRLGFSKTGLVLVPRLVRSEDRALMIDKFEAKARAAGATQIGANHVLAVILEERYYTRYGDGMQGGQGSGPTDPPRDRAAELEYAMHEPFTPFVDPSERVS